MYKCVFFTFKSLESHLECNYGILRTERVSYTPSYDLLAICIKYQ